MVTGVIGCTGSAAAVTGAGDQVLASVLPLCLNSTRRRISVIRCAVEHQTCRTRRSATAKVSTPQPKFKHIYVLSAT